MAKIKALTPDIYNLISAGEVVDNPVGAVKELAENSIDAGSRRIKIEIEGGGCDQITVTDEGCGISEEDVELAFARYATSKLESASDIIGIQSLGFRGEALASISAVSRIKLTTRTEEMDAGVCVSVENGVIVDKHYVSANVGTKIEVRDLYYNTPARKKFLKSPAGEKAEITKFVAKFILTNYHVAISYVADGKVIYDSKGTGLDEAIFAVYGEDCLSNCIPVKHQNGDLRITGYIGTPEYSKPNKNYQTLSVNGRCVTDDKISPAIAQAYRPYLMTRKFPFFVLNIEIPSATVDVNIHPKKSVVRFSNHGFIAGQFYHAVQDALQDYSLRRSEEIFSTKEAVAAKIDELEKDGTIDIMNPGQKEDVLAIEQATYDAQNKHNFDDFVQEIGREVSVANARKRLGLSENVQKIAQSSLTISPEYNKPAPPQVDEGKILFDRTRVLGSPFKTYLILELDDKIILVDQHAAHERILFNKFLEGAPTVMQPLLLPYVFTVMDDEALFIKENLQNILTAGFEIEEFGHNTFRITAVSSLLIETKISDFVQFLLSSIDEFKLDDRQLIVETIAKKACKAAVKAGDSLGELEIQYILKEVYHNKILQCPHGRPITVVLTKTQIEKMFKRIV